MKKAHIWISFALFSILVTGRQWGLCAQDRPLQLDSLQQVLTNPSLSDSLRANTLLQIGSLMMRVSMDSSLFYAQESQKIISRLKNPRQSFTLLLLQGSQKAIQGQESEGLPLFLKALDLAEKFPETIPEDRKTATLSNIGGIYYSLGELDKAASYLKRAITILEKTDNSMILGDTYRGALLLYIAKKDSKAAKYYAEKAYAVYTAIGRELESKLVRLFLVNVAIMDGKFQDAYQELHDLLPFFQQANVPLHLGELQVLLGRAALETKRYPEAYQNLRAAVNTFHITKSALLLKDAHFHLNRYFEQKGPVDSAYFHYKQYKTQDSILLNQQKNREIKQTEAELLSRLKEQEYALLKQENRDIQLQNSVYLILFFSLCAVLIVVSLSMAALQKRKAFVESQNQEIGKLHKKAEQALEQSVRLSQEKQQLISLLSHDLRAPLEIIQINVALLEDKIPQPNPELQEIRENVRLIHEFSLRIMATQNIETLDIPLYLQPVPLDEVARYAINRFKTIAAQKSIQLVWKPASKAPAARADQFFLKECLANLVANAVHFSPPQGTVVISAKAQGQQVVLSVCDSGPGNPLFTGLPDPFKKPTQSATGIGYGLYLTQRYVQLMGGHISALTPPEGGATVEISLPAV